jgi:hypothetical protein
LADVWGATTAPVLRAPPDVVERITGFHVHRGALAACRRAAPAAVADLLGGRRLVVLEDIVDHANLGTILRTAAALGWDGVLITHGSADPLYRRAVKTSMGAVFRLPWARLDAGADVAALLRGAGFTVVALALAPGATGLDDARARLAGQDRVALLVGREGPLGRLPLGLLRPGGLEGRGGQEPDVGAAEEEAGVEVRVAVLQAPVEADPGATGVARLEPADEVAGRDLVAGGDGGPERLVGCDDGAVVDGHDRLAGDEAGEPDAPGGGRRDRVAGRAGEVDAAVAGQPLEGRGFEVADDGPGVGRLPGRQDRVGPGLGHG